MGDGFKPHLFSCSFTQTFAAQLWPWLAPAKPHMCASFPRLIPGSGALEKWGLARACQWLCGGRGPAEQRQRVSWGRRERRWDVRHANSGLLIGKCDRRHICGSCSALQNHTETLALSTFQGHHQAMWVANQRPIVDRAGGNNVSSWNMGRVTLLGLDCKQPNEECVDGFMRCWCAFIEQWQGDISRFCDTKY